MKKDRHKGNRDDRKGIGGAAVTEKNPQKRAGVSKASCRLGKKSTGRKSLSQKNGQ